MTLRLLRVEKTPHPESWRQLYRRTPALADAPYAEQHAAWLAHRVQGAGALQRAMTPLGYDVHEVFSDIEPLQRAWAREHDVPVPRVGWSQAIPLAQARALRPDVLYSYDARNLDFAWLDRLRIEVPSVRVVAGFIGSSSFDIDTFRRYDILLTCTDEYARYFRAHGLDPVVVTHVVDEAIAPLLGQRAPREGVVFSGSLWRDAQGHHEREALLEAMIGLPGFTLHSPQAVLTRSRDLLTTTARRGVFATHRLLVAVGVPTDARRRLPIIGKGATWTHWPRRQWHPRLHAAAQPPVFGLDMFRLLHGTRVTLNAVDHAEAANMRLFEATGAGSCLLTSHRENLASLFVPDAEVVTYRSPAEAREKAAWLMAHPDEAEAIAQAGQRRTLRDYTWTQRAAQLDALVRARLAER
ncbi:MAG: glycosyltransferase [Gemmatimonadetes bacterium]|nr:glycosyltransferase [Gemmatimonadota bacterium]